jgi:hypothetical protein
VSKNSFLGREEAVVDLLLTLVMALQDAKPNGISLTDRPPSSSLCLYLCYLKLANRTSFLSPPLYLGMSYSFHKGILGPGLALLDVPRGTRKRVLVLMEKERGLQLGYKYMV